MPFYRRRGFWLALLSIAVVAGVAVTAISYFAAQALTHHRSSRPAVTPADSGLAYDVVPLRARDGTVLEGWWIRPRDGARRADLATVVLAHAADGETPGAPTGKAGMLRQAAWLSRAGYIVLAFDFRSYGGSQGSRTTGGEAEQQDLEAAIRLVRERVIGGPIAVLGEGLGARVGLEVIAQDPSLKALVADSPPRSRFDALRSSAPSWIRFAPPALVRTMGKLEEPAELYRLAGVRPVLLILGQSDPGWDRNAREKAVQELGSGNATWAWIAKAQSRLRSIQISGEEYRARVEEFLEASFRPRASATSAPK